MCRDLIASAAVLGIPVRAPGVAYRSTNTNSTILAIHPRSASRHANSPGRKRLTPITLPYELQIPAPLAIHARSIIIAPFLSTQRRPRPGRPAANRGSRSQFPPCAFRLFADPSCAEFTCSEGGLNRAFAVLVGGDGGCWGEEGAVEGGSAGLVCRGFSGSGIVLKGMVVCHLPTRVGGWIATPAWALISIPVVETFP